MLNITAIIDTNFRTNTHFEYDNHINWKSTNITLFRLKDILMGRLVKIYIAEICYKSGTK